MTDFGANTNATRVVDPCLNIMTIVCRQIKNPTPGASANSQHQTGPPALWYLYSMCMHLNYI